ncbi:winged helix DNA-binding domain-containing protein [Jiangella ureilytica]|uniref:Winged helix DNA-binding domain-containing protein n=1 Tax=Jiangella ureilytica TaxID=2530374 RepID=A0A4R4S559_9ACTN|nr:winged helix DNA-binding domain-containing protein [Jiangella ureilytica]TDC56702.1 winged helix DNA-binding domain-containing protein [Jiangella ureilytica]
MDHAELMRRRLSTVGLGAPLEAEGPAGVVAWFGAVQSQDYHSAKWGVGQRLAGTVTDAGLDQAFADGELLRTHVLRPTWHFVTPADIRWLLGLTAPRVHQLNAYYNRQSELDEPLLRRAADLIAAALSGGNHLTRTEVAAELERHGIVAERFRLGYILIYAELEQVICSGPLHGRQHTYALLDERAPAADPLDRDEALARLATRFFTSHGPATVKDLSWWSSLTLTDLKAGIAAAGDALESIDVDGVTYWCAAGAFDAVPSHVDETAVHLLQPYDEYLVGYSESKPLLDLSGVVAGTRLDSAANGVLLLGTQVAGRWKRTLRSGEVALDVGLYEPFHDAVTPGLQAAADAHGAFVERSATVAVSLL